MKFSVQQALFGSCLMHRVGQTMIGRQAVLRNLLTHNVLPRRLPVINIEGACATGSLALNAARASVLCDRRLVLAVGVEKMFCPGDPGAVLADIEGAFDNLDRASCIHEYSRAASEIGRDWDPQPGRSVAMDTYAVQAAWHMHRFGTTARQIAAASAKIHCNGALNPKEPSLSRAAADQAYVSAGVSPAQISVAEVHDATSFSEIYQEEVLRFCPEGGGGPYVESGATANDGPQPMNPSGGLVSKGHPIAAKGRR